MGTIITAATSESVPQLVTSVAALFAEDGGHRDRHMDLEWPEREGAAYYAALVDDDRSLCLLSYSSTEAAERRDRVAGHLIGRRIRPNPLRPDAVTVVLESIRVNPAHRRQGIGTRMMGHFSDWAISHGANEASVTAFSTNTSAIEFYCHHGFAPFELTLHRPL